MHDLGSSHRGTSHKDGNTRATSVIYDNMPRTGCNGRAGHPHHRGTVGGNGRGRASNGRPPIRTSTRETREGDGGLIRGRPIYRRVTSCRGVTSRASFCLACRHRSSPTKLNQAETGYDSSEEYGAPTPPEKLEATGVPIRHLTKNKNTHTYSTCIIFTVPVRAR